MGTSCLQSRKFTFFFSLDSIHPCILKVDIQNPFSQNQHTISNANRLETLSNIKINATGVTSKSLDNRSAH